MSINFKSLKTRKTTIQVDATVHKALKQHKQEGETYNDTLKRLLELTTKEYSTKHIFAKQYERKKLFIEVHYDIVPVGVEFSYNEPGSKSAFTFDLHIDKIYFDRKTHNPSHFFGVKQQQKHLSHVYLELYLNCVLAALQEEFNTYAIHDVFSLVYWKKLYTDYALSLDSFTQDIEDVLRLSIEEKPSQEVLASMNKAPAHS